MIMKSRVRKPSTKIQNAHTRKTVYMFFLYFTTDLQRRPNWTDSFFSKPNQTRGFSQNGTELEKSIAHISIQPQNFAPVTLSWNYDVVSLPSCCSFTCLNVLLCPKKMHGCKTNGDGELRLQQTNRRGSSVYHAVMYVSVGLWRRQFRLHNQYSATKLQALHISISGEQRYSLCDRLWPT